ncbi:MAG: hypothetical protein PWQ96_1995 [Clostridia bacterium]|jgi:HSP20 family protein|nr:heat-shock protein Hsp20 [Clostridiales bacterium]MDK2986351.1 hypothetical protein [Clostridia bacterium]
MPLIPYDPFRNLENWRREMDRLFDYPTFFERGFAGPRVDIHETENEVVVSCELPGLEKKEDVQVEVKDNVLEISGNIARTNEVREEQMFRRERYMGRFHRSITLPSRVKSEGTKATYRNGILEIRMPKAAGDNRKHIDIEFH